MAVSQETTDLSQVTDKLYHIILYQMGFELTILVVMGTVYTSSCKSDYHTITTTTTPEQDYGYYYWSRNCIPFRNNRLHLHFLLAFVLLNL